MMFRFRVFIISLFSATALISQTKLKPGFDGQEFLDVLHLEWAHQDSGSKYAPKTLPLNYKRMYRSQEYGLKNKFDFWLRNDSVGVICLRYTVGGVSWLENFYSGMIKAEGSLQLNDTTKFNYKFSNDTNALVHHGWAIGTCYLAPFVTQTINEYYKKGVKEFIIVGHSQGAALSFLMRSYLQYAPADLVPKDITYKVYCSAAPKPGNLFYAYDFDFITRNGWAYRIVNANDWVPETPFSVQTIEDLHPTNPFTKRKEIMRRRVKNPLIRAYVNHAVNDMQDAAQKTNRKYKKYLTKRMGKFIKKSLKEYQDPIVQESNFYMPAGIPIILQPDSSYNQKFRYDGENVFLHHMFEPYIYLTELYYLKK
ncbi:MAG: lipase family protein [Bacteroidetes bacterium]|nr:lipase family protein [Bacteroidota bacterium]